MRGWLWVVYHRDAKQAMLCNGIVDDESKARELTEIAMRVGDELVGWGLVTGPGCTENVCRRDHDGRLVWRPAHEDPELRAAQPTRERELGTGAGPLQSADVSQTRAS